MNEGKTTISTEAFTELVKKATKFDVLFEGLLHSTRLSYSQNKLSVDDDVLNALMGSVDDYGLVGTRIDILNGKSLPVSD